MLKLNNRKLNNFKNLSSVISIHKEDSVKIGKNFEKFMKFQKIQSRKFVLYIPKKKLNFIKHPKYGKVYPVYIGDENYNKKNNPKKLMPPIIFATAMNLYVFLTSWGLFPVSSLYSLFHSNELIFLTSVFLNVYLLRKYFKYLSDYSNRVRCMYLLPTGNKIVLECFDGSVSRLENLDIYNFNIKNDFNFEEKEISSWKSVFNNNNNNFKANIEWGRNRQNIFEGKRKIFDYEIFSQIVGRNNIDTNIQKFKKEMPIGMYSNEDKRKIMSFYANKKFSLYKIDKNRLSHHYFLLRKKYIVKKKVKLIKEQFNFY